MPIVNQTIEREEQNMVQIVGIIAIVLIVKYVIDYTKKGGDDNKTE